MPQPEAPAQITVRDAGTAPEEGLCLRLLQEAQTGCWFDRRATAGWSLLMVDPWRVLRGIDGVWEAMGAVPGTTPPGPQGFAGGWAGWLSYEGAVTALGLPRPAAGGWPTAVLGYYPACLAIDHRRGRARVVGRGPAGAAAANAWLERLARVRSSRGYRAPRGAVPGPLHASGIGRDEACARVREVQRWIRAGDVYVANLTYRIRLDGPLPPLLAYPALAAAQRAPYAALLRDGTHWVLSCSPELLLRRRGLHTWTRPIKGTRPTGGGAGAALSADPKERAELTMIVDLERNDLGRVARVGSVRVHDLFSVQTHPGLQHLWATVAAEVPAPAGAVLRAMLPGGSVTGAPKRSAVEHLARLEADPRGVYTGTLGYCDDGGDMEWNVAIRTLQVGPGPSLYGTGGGITADSDPAREYAETRLKARGPLRALGVPWE